MSRFQQPPTKRGYNVHEVISALQKAIRRSQPEAAAYWVVELDQSGHSGWAWNRLLCILSEDVGPAAPLGLVADVKALHRIWADGKDKKAGSGGLAIIHATLLLAMAPKNRLANYLAIVLASDHAERLEIPDEALDRHTQRGKKMGRGMEHFMTDAALLIQPDLEAGDLEALETKWQDLRRRLGEEDPTLPDNAWPREDGDASWLPKDSVRAKPATLQLPGNDE
jgi:hypothetical protein